MRLLLINAITSSYTIENIYPPLGLGYIASYLREYLPNINIKIIEGNVEETLVEFSPDLVGISSVSQNYGIALKIAKLCKKKRLPVIIGGTHISTLPSTITPEMDLAVIGEGEQTMLEVIKTFIQYGLDMSKMAKIRGLVFKNKNNKLVFTGDRELIQPLDKIPFPARDLLRIPIRGQLHLFSSRGCPYKCTFCQSTRFFNKIRSFSPEYVVRELEFLIEKYKPVSICFYDDLFVTNRKRLKRIVQLIEEKGINKKTEFYVNVRANQADEEVAELLKRMNVTTVDMGLESGTDKILQFLKGKNSSVAQNKRAVEIFTNFGMRTNGTFIIGTPGETREDILETYNFIKRSKLSYFATYILVPLPNTPLWEYAKNKGLVSENMDWEKLKMEVTKRNFKERVVISDLDKKELYKLYLKFEKLRKIRRLMTWLKRGIKEPFMAPRFFIKKVKLWWTNLSEPIGFK